MRTTAHWRVLATLAGAGGLALGLLATGPSAALAADGHAFVCSGTVNHPGTLTGQHQNVTVRGACVVDAGTTDVHGNLVLARGAALTAIFGRDDKTGKGNSNLTVAGNLIVRRHASLMLGCYSRLVHLWTPTGLAWLPDFPCYDDPSQSHPTLNSNDIVDGSLIAFDPLGVVVHDSTIKGNVVELGGGAGTGCANVGIFQKYFDLPDYSDYANTVVYGNLIDEHMDTCWYGAQRDHVRGSMVMSHNVSTPDAGEVVTNVVRGSLVCQGNSPSVEFGDSHGKSNEVGKYAVGQCGFGVKYQTPAKEGGVPPHAKRVWKHISVHLHR